MRVAEMMSPAPIAVGVEDPLSQLSELLQSVTFHHFPVLAGGELVGVIKDTDIYRAMVLQGDTGAPLIASQIMTSHPITVGARMSVQSAANLMLSEGVSCLPVLDNAELIGIVTWKDMLKACVESDCFQG
ncbi:CBS domain-containing protein [Aeromonas diversa]|uniref:CBS domain-containing protein n=1 Tax=Aeromonas diversa CDC 2478-85 TaxID=1268237 RepID=N9U2L7_9GAMM|nr:CBS domain-containing protein [Aeromonas diversa]ENY72614.1 hypothetical protein G114_06732 [Aeromonas diversa CDC 2478-85]